MSKPVNFVCRSANGIPWTASARSLITPLVIVLLYQQALTAGEPVTGEKLWSQQCARCHGLRGEGTSEYSSPLHGDKSIVELTKVISTTMPEDTEQKCSAEDAGRIAEYIHSEFYTQAARERTQAAKIEFSRLTATQIQNSISDLLGSFYEELPWPNERGLTGKYFNLRTSAEDTLVETRIDPGVNFHFGGEKPPGFPAGPGHESHPPDVIHDEREFSIRWDGSLLVPATGTYELIVESENGFRMYFNQNQFPVIDAWAHPSSERIFRFSTKLLGGRAYPLSLLFFRYQEPTSSISLRWKRPGHAEEVIPARYLAPIQKYPGGFVLNTPFPPDDRNSGVDRGNGISKAWQEAVSLAALETAREVVRDMTRLAGIRHEHSNDLKRERSDQFCRSFVKRAFRRPLTPDEEVLLLDRPRQGVSFDQGMRRVVLMALMSPGFLYRESTRAPFDDFATASWMSFGLWDSIPDVALLNAAERNELQTREQIEAQVERMLPNVRTQTKLREFFLQWLQTDRTSDLVKNHETFPGFDSSLSSDLRNSLEFQIEDFISNPDAKFTDLLQGDEYNINGRLAKFYGLELPEDAGFQKVTIRDQGRAGILTHPFLMASFADSSESSPIHRGVFVARRLLGRQLNPPPDAVSPLAPDLHAGLSTRERVLLQTSPANCQSCHAMINGLGFSLENFDATGRFRILDRERSIDSSGAYIDRAGAETHFSGSQDLGEFLKSSPEVHEAFVEQLFLFTVRQPITAFGSEMLDHLVSTFKENEFRIRPLIREIIVVSALKMQEINPPQPVSTSPLPPATP
ncbi:DUF1592 domain-containing protein [Planctomicrobium sp. SH661]|uniref:DUF1592 domain-containing protein n=1 Tax=Planctomicrobium sp. SH661 TaxID=3448124 RepID=UPI003F5B9954